MIQEGVSIVVCTYNGAARLPETIRHIAAQVLSEAIPWEFVLVDNGSEDGGAPLTEQKWKELRAPAPLVIVHEPQRGLSFARTRGFETARYDYVIMCDDDNWLDQYYAALVFEIMNANTSFGGLGGNGELVYETEPPDWVRHFPIFASGRQAARSGPATKNRLYGAGCVIRKSAYLRMKAAGYRSILTDRLGKELSSGGDYELCYALVMCGYKLWYDDRLVFKHFIPSDRFTIQYYLRYLKESSRCFEVLEPYGLICEYPSLSYKTFIMMRLKLLFHYLRKYARFKLMALLSGNNNTKRIISQLRCYSISHKIRILIPNNNRVNANFRHGKELQRRFQGK